MNLHRLYTKEDVLQEARLLVEDAARRMSDVLGYNQKHLVLTMIRGGLKELVVLEEILGVMAKISKLASAQKATILQLTALAQIDIDINNQANALRAKLSSMKQKV